MDLTPLKSLEKEKLVGSLLNAVLKMINNSVVKKQDCSSPSIPSASDDKGKQ